MKTRKANIVLSITTLFTALLICGCATSPTPRFYLLRPEGTKSTPAAADAPTVVVRPVEIADYLDRPQIVIRKSSREIAHAQFDRWAEPLDKQLNLYLTVSLANEVQNFNVKFFPMNEEEEAKYEVDVDIFSLDGTPEGEVNLDAKWKIRTTGKDSRTVKEARINLTKPCLEQGIPGVVAATEQLISDLSKTIAAELKECK